MFLSGDAIRTAGYSTCHSHCPALQTMYSLTFPSWPLLTACADNLVELTDTSYRFKRSVYSYVSLWPHKVPHSSSDKGNTVSTNDSRNSSVGKEAAYGDVRPGPHFPKDVKGFLSIPQRPDRLWGPLSLFLPAIRYRRLFL
jgi:hypothetical protein